MERFLRTLLVVGVVLIGSSSAFAQYSSLTSGSWNTPGTWTCNCVPITGSVTINNTHIVTIPAAYQASATSVTVSNGGVLQNSSALVSTLGTVTFQNGSEYRHNINGVGTIPASTWQTGSTCRITGVVGSTTAPSGLGQPFHHFIWDCAGQTAANPFLQGALTTVNGDLSILNTGGTRQVTLGGTAVAFNGALTIAGSLNISNQAKLQLTSSGTYTVTVGNDVNLLATSPTSSHYNLILNSSGAAVTLNVADDFIFTGGGKMNMVIATGALTNLNIAGDLNFTNGVLLKDAGANPAAAVNIAFNGTTPQVYTGGGTYSGQSINYRIASTADVDLQTFGLGQPASTFTSDGIVRLASTDPSSAILGNIRPNTRTFSSGSIIYTGAATQFIGLTHPSGSNLTTTILNASNVTLASDATIGGTLNLTTGDINVASNKLTVTGTVNAGTHHLNITSNSSLEIGGTGAFGLLPIAGGTDINNFTIARTSGSVLLQQNLNVLGTFTQTAGDVQLAGVDFILNGPFARTAGTIISNASSSSLLIQGAGAVPATASFSGAFDTFDFNRDLAVMATSSSFSVENLLLRRGTLNSTSALTVNSGGLIHRFNGTLGSAVGGTGPLLIRYSNTEDIFTGPELTPATDRIEDVLVSSNASVSLDSDVIINGDLTVSSGGLFAQDNDILLRSDLTVDALSNFNESILTFDGNTTLSGSSLPAFGTLEVTAGSTLIFPTDEQIFVAGNIDFSNTSTITTNNISLTLDGEGLQTISPAGISINNLTVNKPDESDVALTAPLSIVGQLAIQTANTDLDAGGFLNLVSTSDAGASGDAWIGPLLDGASISGTVHVRRFMSSEGKIYRYISSPVSGMDVDYLNNSFPITGGFPGSSVCATCGTQPSMFSYNNAIEDYANFPTSSILETMDVGRGYAAFNFQNSLPGPITIDYFGLVNQGPQTLPLGFNPSAPTESWNLVGNPYPATIGWGSSEDPTGWTRGVNVMESIAVKNNGEGGGGFQYWDGENGSLVDGLIAKGQAFWVRTDGATDLTLEVNELAKISSVPAPFFRTYTPAVNSLILTLTGNGASDPAYLKERKHALMKEDRFDVPKLDNDYFDLSTYSFESTPVALAINAVDYVDCLNKVAIRTADMTPGYYELSMVATGTFATRTWRLVDKFTNTTTTNFTNGMYAFTVTSDVQSKAVDRFEMILDIERPDLNISVVSATPKVCEDAAVILVPQAQSLYEYQLEVNGALVGDRFAGSGDLAIKIANEDLHQGENEVRVTVFSSCPQLLSTTVSVNKQEYIKATVAPKTSCFPGTFSLQASGAPEFNWYSTQDGGDALAHGASFTTPEVNSAATYFVAAVNANGCEGQLVPATVSIVLPDPVVITPNDGALLVSNYPDGNQWSFNGVALTDATEAYLKAVSNGKYQVTVTKNGCVATGSIDFIVTGLEGEDATAIAWPNPVKKFLNVNLPAGMNVQEVAIESMEGRSMERIQSPKSRSTIDMSSYAPGLYILTIYSDKGKRVEKILKD